MIFIIIIILIVCVSILAMQIIFSISLGIHIYLFYDIYFINITSDYCTHDEKFHYTNFVINARNNNFRCK